jgi:hypothetical protein
MILVSSCDKQSMAPSAPEILSQANANSDRKQIVQVPNMVGDNYFQGFFSLPLLSVLLLLLDFMALAAPAIA